MDEFSAIQKCPSLSYLNLDKLHPTQISSGNESEISSLESGYNDHINTNTSANSLSHQDHISEIGIGFKLTSYGSWTPKDDQTKHFFSILKSGIVLNRKLGVTNWFLIGHILLTRNSRVYSLTVSSNLYITELIAIYSESRNCPFITAQAMCKFKRCFKFSIQMKKCLKENLNTYLWKY